jgi:hypothetical protein
VSILPIYFSVEFTSLCSMLANTPGPAGAASAAAALLPPQPATGEGSNIPTSPIPAPP